MAPVRQLARPAAARSWEFQKRNSDYEKFNVSPVSCRSTRTRQTVGDAVAMIALIGRQKMTRFRLAQIIVILCLSTVQLAMGQTSHQPAQKPPVGHWRNGQYIGFMPKHLRNQPLEVQRAGLVPPAYPQPSSPEPPVAQTFFQEEIPPGDASGPVAEEVMPPILNTADGDEIAYDMAYTEAPEMYYAGPRVWGRMDALLWWTKGMNLPPLVTTSPDGTAQEEAGVLGNPDTTILFGNERVNQGVTSGGRFTVGTWLDPFQTNGIEVTYSFLGEETATFFGSNGSFNILARPFFNTETGEQDSRLIVFPDVVNGSLFVDARSEFQTAEVLYRRASVRSFQTQIDYYFGYRFAELDERVVFDSFTSSRAEPTIGTTIDLCEQFRTKNTFNGGQLGLKFTRQPAAAWLLEMGIKFAVGGTRSRAVIAGERTTTTANGDSSTAEGGLLALGTNIGQYEETVFSTVTEIGINLRRRIQCGVIGTIGYTFMYWSDVNRPGDIIDLTVNPTQIPPGTLDGTARPAFAFDTTDFSAQGLNVGLEYSF